MTKVLRIIVAVNVLLATLFSLQFSSFIGASYQVKRFEERVRELTSINEGMGLELLDRGQLENVNRLAQRLGFQRVERIDYISSGEIVVSAR